MNVRTAPLSAAFLAAIAALLAVGCYGVTDTTVSPSGSLSDAGVDPVVYLPARLETVAVLSTSTAAVGQEVHLLVSVTNVGESVATDVTPATPLQTGNGLAVLKSAPLAAELAPGASHTFEFIYDAIDPGALSFTVNVSALDRTHDVTVESEPTSVALVIEGSALLAVTSLDAPVTGVVGTPFTVTMRVANGGQSTAFGVTPLPLSTDGSGSVTLASGPTPTSVDLPSGGEATFTLSYVPTAAGPVVFTGGARGTGPGDVELTAQAISTSPVEIESPAVLEAMVSAPGTVTTGHPFTVTLLVRNTGTAPARDVLPDPLAPTLTTLSGTASATTTTTQTARVIPGGGTVAFTWTYVASGTGDLRFTARATGEDALMGTVVSSEMAQSAASKVLAPAQLNVVSINTPPSLTRGQTFNVVVTVENIGGTAINGVSVDSPLTVLKTGGANATTTSMPAPQNLAPGASATYTFSYTESGTAAGTLVFRAGATGVSAATGATVSANPTDSTLAVVSAPATLLVETITLPGRISRGQGFNAVVSVKNTGGNDASGVAVTPTVQVTGTANAATASNPAAVALAAGARASFTFAYTENGTGSGSLRIAAVASGSDAVTGNAVSSPSVSSAAMPVEVPATLEISTFVLPATLTRGDAIALSMTVSNTGEAAATGVLPLPNRPTVIATGGVAVTTSSTPTAVTIPGMSSQTFTWTYTETGTAAGTLAFTGAARGEDANSGAVVNASARTTNVASVGSTTGCQGSQSYVGFGGVTLEEDRLDLTANTDRHRVKPYRMLVGEINRVLGVTPGGITGQAATFNEPPQRWSWEPEMSAVSMFQLFTAAFQGCLQKTNTGTAYAANPTATTAGAQCEAWQRAFWSREPTAAEKTACVSFATSTANGDTNPRRRWAYTCASVLSSAGFIAE